MSDLISRRAAIEAVDHITSSMSVCVNTDECHGMKRMQRQAVIELANLPSAQPEPLVKESRTLVNDLVKDTISRQAAIKVLHDEIVRRRISEDTNDDGALDEFDTETILRKLPSAQPEPSIPILWIEKHVDWLKNMDNEFANLTAMNISTMVKKWKKEQEDNDGSDKQTGGD